MGIIHTTEHEIINAKINALKIAGDWIPGIKIIQSLQPNQNLFMCRAGLKKYGLSENFFYHLPNHEYKKLIFNPKDSNTCLLGCSDSTDSSPSAKEYHIRYDPQQEDQEVELIIIYYLLPDRQGKPQFSFTQIISLGFLSWAVPKTKRIAEEVSFREKNHTKFSQLTDRNRRVLSLMSRGLKAEEIGEKMFISVNTVNSHKKRIKEILETNDTWNLTQYGYAFDLI